VDTIEIESAVVEGARRFGPRVERAFTDPRSRIHVNDAKSFFARQREPYDIIISEPSNPWVSGVSGLFTEEFYDHAGHSLTEDGLLVQWVQLYELNMQLLSGIIKALNLHFQDFDLYTTDSDNLLIVAKKSGGLPPPDTEFLFRIGLAQLLERVGIGSPADINVRRVAGRELLMSLFERYPGLPNSDFYPVLDTGAAVARFKRVSASDVGGVGTAPLPIVSMLDDQPANLHPEEVTASPLHAKTIMAVTARGLLEDIAGDESFRPQDLYPRQELGTVLRATLGMQGCEIPEQLLLEPMLSMASAIHSVLSHDQIARLWTTLEGYPCADRLDDRLTAWMGLFRATTLERPAEMVHFASTLAAIPSANETMAQRNYRLGAWVTGHLALGEPAAAMRVISVHAPHLLRKTDAPPYLLLLAGVTIDRMNVFQPAKVVENSTGHAPDPR
jgi:hypothetical protein